MSNVRMKYPGFLDKALTLSYDDGVNTDARMIEILNKYGIKCTFNINTMCYGEDGKVCKPGETRRMSRNEVINTYKDCGHEIAVHTLRHQWLSNLPTYDLIQEVLEDKRNIEEMFGTIVRGMAYPYGVYDNDVVDVLKNCGIVYSRTTISTNNFILPNDWLRLPATCHHEASNLSQLTDRFINSSYCCPWLFYLWGHSYEFERKGNWDIIEDFCKKVGGREDIWYATNIQVYDYVAAYKSLQFSANMNRAHNPTATDVYFSINGKNYIAKSGQTLDIE